ncbi:MAG: hypothetical protein AAB403_01885 [Planctomycetota bacterium]
MALKIDDRTLERIAIVDDDKSVRDTYETSVEELEVEAVNESGPLPSLDEFVNAAPARADAAVCDFKLRVKNYANFDGAELVARWFDRGFPALLCTKWDRASIDELRKYRSRIPVLVRPTDLDPERIVEGLTICIQELAGKHLSSRKSYRTLVRVEEVTADRSPYAYVVVPAWNPSEVVRLLMSDIPGSIQPRVKTDARLYAEVNLGAESYEDLFFRSWEGQ